MVEVLLLALGMDCSFRIWVLGKEVCFVGRWLEVSKLFELAKGVHPVPIAIYGPEGCGKTTLVRYVVRRLGSRNYVAIYIDALASDLRDALEVWGLDLEDLIEVLMRDLGFSLPSMVSKLVARIVEEVLARLRFFGRGLFLAVDDVYKAIGLENVDRYTKMLYEWIAWRAPRYGIENLLIVLTTSEGVSKRILARHTYVEIYTLWNLDPAGFAELVEQLDPRRRPEDLYIVTGGNPRLAIELARYGWDVEKVKKLYSERIRSTLRMASIDRDRIRALVEDPDTDPQTAAKLEELGLMIELFRNASLSPIPTDRDLGVGKEWAWQTPLHRNIVAEILRETS